MKLETEYEVEINDNFVRSQLQALCIRRYECKDKEDLISSPPCKVSEKCKIDSSYNNLEWGECTKLVGSCMTGEDLNSSWIDSAYNSGLRNCLNSSINIDWLLYLSQKRYRDHSTHQLFVGVLGWFLLGCKLKINNSIPGNLGTSPSLINWISKKIGLTEEEVEIAWWISSLFHDHAYPLAHMLRVTPPSIRENYESLLKITWDLLGYEKNPALDIFRGLYNFTLLASLHEAAKTDATDVDKRKGAIFEILRKRLVPYFFEVDEFNEKFYRGWYDHGVLAAANLASIIGTNNANKVMIPAIRAIAIHNGGLYPERVDIQKDPLAFFLILCDECQEWGRRIVVDDETELESSSIKLSGLIKQEDGSYLFGDSLKIIFEYENASSLSRTGWNYPIFVNSKKNAFNRLHVSEDFPIKKINFHIWIPHESQLTTT